MLAWLAMLPLVTQCQAQAPRSGPAQSSPQPRPIEGKVGAETVAKGLEHPWALAFLPDGRILVTERPGRLRIVAQGRQALGAARPACRRSQAKGQGGLLDVAIDPKFEENRLVYLSYAEPGEGGAGTAVARGRLGEGGAGERAGDLPAAAQGRAATATSARGWCSPATASCSSPRATGRATGSRRRTWSSGLGKLVRINPDGSIPDDNPFVGKSGARPEIYSLRAPQHAGGGAAPGDRAALDGRARRAGRRRAQPSRGGEELRLAGHHLRHRLLRRQDRRGHREGRGWSSRSTTGTR